jgi:hypothetical protein
VRPILQLAPSRPPARIKLISYSNFFFSSFRAQAPASKAFPSSFLFLQAFPSFFLFSFSAIFASFGLEPSRGFAKNRTLTDRDALASAFSDGKAQLEIAKRQAIVYSLYASKVKSIMDIKP